MLKSILPLAVIAVLGCARLPAQSTDSEFLTKVLSDVKAEAATVQDDAAQLKAITESNASWQSFAEQLRRIKIDINRVVHLVQELNDFRIVAVPWQQIAIDRINPLLRELASNTETTINKLNENPARVHLPTYKKYVSAQYELATDLTSTIGDFVEYGKAKAKFESLSRALEMPEP